MSSNPADLLPPARIRLAALELFGAQGFEKTTVRQIAARAGVSPGLVIHYFGSKVAVREACDELAMELLASQKAPFLGGGMLPSLQDHVAQHPEMAVLVAYLVRALRDGGEVAEHAHRRMCEFTAETMERAERAGAVRLPADREAAAALLTTWSLGFLVLSDLFARRLGGTTLMDPAVLARYADVAVEMFTSGVFTEEYAEKLRATIDTPTTRGPTDERPGDPDD